MLVFNAWSLFPQKAHVPNSFHVCCLTSQTVPNSNIATSSPATDTKINEQAPDDRRRPFGS